jgi:4-amino-4-deoxy-L-arabinose transferase-like glycosyltransferase
MRVELVIAGVACLVLAVGHAAIGRRRELPGRMVRFTWDVVTLFGVAFGVLLLVLAAADDLDTRTLVLRWAAAVWVAATVRALWDVRRRPSSLLRFPVPLVFLLVAAMCWAAST